MPRKVSNASNNPSIPELNAPVEEHMMSHLEGGRPVRQSQMASVEITPEMMDQLEDLRAMEAEKKRVEDILRRRPERMKGGIWMEIWSFVVVTDEKAANPREVG
jgi:hypothetical protein